MQFRAGVETVGGRSPLKGGEGHITTGKGRDVRILSRTERAGLLRALPSVAAVW